MTLIKLSDLKPNDYNPRKNFDKEGLISLCNSIKKTGIIEPLVVRKTKNGKYEIICGMRRYACLKSLGFEEVECNILNVTRAEAINISFEENEERENLNPIERANYWKAMIEQKITDDFDKKSTQIQYQKNPKLLNEELEKEFAKLFAMSNNDPYVIELATKTRSAKSISQHLHLLNLPDELQSAVISKELSFFDAYQISRLRLIEDEELKTRLMKEAFEKNEEGFDLGSLIEENLLIHKDIRGQRKTELEQTIKDIEERIDDITNSLIMTKDLLRKDFLSINKELKDYKEKTLNSLTEINEIIEKIENIRDSRNFSKEIRSVDDILFDKEINLERIKKEKLEECPHCMGKVDINKLNEKVNSLIKEKEDIIKERDRMDNLIYETKRKSSAIKFNLDTEKKYQSDLESYRRRKIEAEKKLEEL